VSLSAAKLLKRFLKSNLHAGRHGRCRAWRGPRSTPLRFAEPPIGVSSVPVTIAAGTGLGGIKGFNTLGKFGDRLAFNMAGGIADAASRSVFNGTDFGDNLMAALPDTLGQTIGGLVTDGIQAAHDGLRWDYGDSALIRQRQRRARHQHHDRLRLVEPGGGRDQQLRQRPQLEQQPAVHLDLHL
jgi:hypothetical protein